jgi:hypothetical protein
MIRDFIERNKAVFVIGFLTLTIFLSIIIISEARRVRKGNDSPKLIRVEDTTAAIETTADDSGIETSGPALNTLDITYSDVDKNYGTLLIAYTDRGFVPNNAKAILGQKIEWVNKTDKSVYIAQKTVFFDEFKTPLFLPAGGVFQFRLYKDGEWGYEVPETGVSGSINILKP